jgi:hypothetical protein
VARHADHLRLRLLAILASAVTGCGSADDEPAGGGSALPCAVEPTIQPPTTTPCSAPDENGLRVCGTPNCDYCSGESWLNCYRPEDVPLQYGESVPALKCAEKMQLASHLEPCFSQLATDGPTFDGVYCCYTFHTMRPPSGRPFVVSGEQRVAAVAATDAWSGASMPGRDDIDDAAAGAIGQAWLADAQLEHASIAAFARLALELLAHAAPPDLVADAHRASLDEIRHAERCFALASRFAKRPLGPGALDVSGCRLGGDLAELAASTFAEGCVGETLAALLAAEARDVASDPEARRALAEIAEDEARHAELAWRIVAWAIERGGATVTNAVRRAFAQELEPRHVLEDPAIDREVYARFGRLLPSQIAEVRAHALASVIRPCLDALLAGSGRARSRRRAFGSLPSSQ